MIALYARQSAEKENSVSIETQLDFCKSMIKINEKNVQVNTYVDKGFSGGNVERPAFKKLIKDIELGKIEKVIVYKLDRISRSLSDFVSIQQIFDKYNVDFVSSQEAFDTSSPYGDVILKILMVFAEFERTTIINRVRDSYQKRSDMGFYMGGRQQYGFELKDTFIDEKKTKMLVPIDDQIEHIKFIYNLYSIENSSLRSVMRALNSKDYSPETGAGWSPSKINSILKNPVYVKADIDVYNYFHLKKVNIVNSPLLFDGSHAALLYGRTHHCSALTDWSDMKLVLAKHDGIIPSDIWLKCQYKIDQNKRMGKSVSNHSSWLSGKVFCGVCGSKMTAIKSSRSDGTNRKYFICSDKLIKKDCSGTVTIYAEDLEEVIHKLILSRLSKIDIVKKDCSNSKSRDIYEAKVKLAEISDKETQLKNFISNSNLNIAAAELVNAQADYLYTKRSVLTDRLNLLMKKNYENINSAYLQDLWISAAFEEKKTICGLFIKQINISANGDIEIIWNI